MGSETPKFEDLPRYQQEFLRYGGEIQVNKEGTTGFLKKFFNENIRGCYRKGSYFAILDKKDVKKQGIKSNEDKYAELIESYLKEVLKELDEEIDLHKVNQNLNLFNEGVGLGIYISKTAQRFFGKDSNLFSEMLYSGKYNRNLISLSSFADIIARFINNYFNKYIKIGNTLAF